MTQAELSRSIDDVVQVTVNENEQLVPVFCKSLLVRRHKIRAVRFPDDSFAVEAVDALAILTQPSGLEPDLIDCSENRNDQTAYR